MILRAKKMLTRKYGQTSEKDNLVLGGNENKEDALLLRSCGY
jgi:hypothetical protein